MSAAPPRPDRAAELRAFDVSAGLFRLLETSADLIAVFDPELRHVYCNEGVCRFMRLSRAEILGTRYDEMPMSRANAERMMGQIQRTFDSGEPQRLEVRGTHRDTHARIVFDISYHPERGPDGRVALVIGVSRDVTRLREAEEHARAGAERLAILLDAVDVAIVGVARDLRLDFANRTAERELAQLASVERPLRGVPVSDMLPPDAVPAVLAAITTVLARGEPLTLEHDLELGARRRRFQFRICPEHESAERMRGVVIIARDLTHERQREAQLRLSERLASLGRIAAGVTHEITNPLAAIYGNLELARLALERFAFPAVGADAAALALADVSDMLDDAHEGAERIRQIIEEIGLLVRAQPGDAGLVDLREIVDKVVRVLGAAIAPKARLELRLEPVPEIAGAAPQLVQVLTNLLENALQAMPPERDPRDNLIVIAMRREGRDVVIRISDNGVGIPVDALGHVFDPFFTTRAVGDGMGLGLTIAHGIVTNHRGTLQIRSTSGQGATVVLTLPVPEP